MFTIKSTTPWGLFLGYYGTFNTLTEAQYVTATVARIARQDHGSTSTYTAVPLPEGAEVKYLHPKYTA